MGERPLGRGAGACPRKERTGSWARYLRAHELVQRIRCAEPVRSPTGRRHARYEDAVGERPLGRGAGACPRKERTGSRARYLRARERGGTAAAGIHGSGVDPVPKNKKGPSL